jgi:hypothetical protein
VDDALAHSATAARADPSEKRLMSLPVLPFIEASLYQLGGLSLKSDIAYSDSPAASRTCARSW